MALSFTVPFLFDSAPHLVWLAWADGDIPAHPNCFVCGQDMMFIFSNWIFSYGVLCNPNSVIFQGLSFKKFCKKREEISYFTGLIKVVKKKSEKGSQGGVNSRLPSVCLL